MSDLPIGHGRNPADRWSGEALRKGDRYLTTEELSQRVFVVGRLVEVDGEWFLERVDGYNDPAVRAD